MELSSRRRSSFHLGKGFMKDFSDIQETNDVAIFVADRLRLAS